MAHNPKKNKAQSGVIYLSRGEFDGRKTWHYVMVNKMRLPILLKQAQTESIDLRNYGKILFSGFGEDPPEAVAEYIKQYKTIH